MSNPSPDACRWRLPVSRRTFLGAAASGVGLAVGPVRLSRADGPDATSITALAFDGDALLVADTILSRSDDDGASWRRLPVAFGTQTLVALASHPDAPGRVVAGLTAGTVLLSEDGGREWESRSAGLPREAIDAIAVAADRPDTFYAALRGDGLRRSEDAGRSWAFVIDRPWIEQTEHDVLALTSVDLATGMGGIWLYGGTGVGLTRVPDCFCRWQDVQPADAMDELLSDGAPSPRAPLPAGESIRALVSAPSAPQTLYAALDSGVWTSRDAGVVWSRTGAHGAVAVAVHPDDPRHVVAATRAGLLRSRDGGRTWAALAAF